MLAAGVATGLTVLAACAGCGGTTTGTANTAGPGLPPAAEPAAAPPLTVRPAGTVRPVGNGPEGVLVDPRDGQVIVALRARRLALVGADGPGMVRTVAVPGTARHLQLAGAAGSVLVPGEDTDVLAEIDLPSGRVSGTTRVGRQPHDAADTGVAGRIVVADELGSAVSFVADGREIARLPGPVQPGGLASAGDGRVGVVDVRGNALYVYDARSMRQVARLPAGAGPTHAVQVGAGRVAVADTRGNAIEVFSLTGTPRRLARLPLPGAPYGLAASADGTSLWVTLTARNELVRLAVDADGTPRRDGPPYPTVRQANSVAVDETRNRAYVAGATSAGTLQTIDLR
ncbi:hypothetical protein BCD48_28815 [Pseudofrankia sp. BMG5.36]|nr:hypothetical protein BCD48_28815 [Pseudofrankia sp. BMG5.36]